MGKTSATGQSNRGFFDGLLSWVSQLREANSLPVHLEDDCLGIEQRLQDIDSEHITSQVTRIISYWRQAIVGDAERPAKIQDFQYLMAELLKTLEDHKAIGGQSIHELNIKLSRLPLQPPSEYRYEIGGGMVVIQLPTPGRLSTAHPLEINPIDFAFVWELVITLKAHNVSAARVSMLVLTIARSLESVPGVFVELVGATKGSFFLKCKIWIRDVFAREQTQQLLDDARAEVIRLGPKAYQAGEAHLLGRPIAEVARLNAETEQALANAERLRKTTPTSQSEEHKREIEQLDVQERKARIRQMEISNSIAALELIEKAKEALARGILEAGELRVDVNGMFLMAIDELGAVQEGRPLPEIAAGETQLKSLDPPAGEQIKTP